MHQEWDLIYIYIQCRNFVSHCNTDEKFWQVCRTWQQCVISQRQQRAVTHFDSSWNELSTHATAHQHWENDLNNISWKIKTAIDSATQRGSTSSFCCQTNTIKKALEEESVGFTGNKKPVEEQRRKTLSDEGQAQLPTIPAGCQGLTGAFVRVSWWIRDAGQSFTVRQRRFSHCDENGPHNLEKPYSDVS